MLAGVLCMMCLFGAFLASNKRNASVTQEAKEAPLVEQLVAVQDVPYVSVKGRYMFHGTIVLARAVEKYAYGNYAQPFSQMSTFNPAAYDAWAADFECPITTNTVPYETQIQRLVFNCRPEWLPELTKYVQLFNLANNHTADQGFPEGIEQTRRHLQEAGVQFFGNYDPTVTEDICEVVALPVRLQKRVGGEEKGFLPVAFCSWHYFNFNRGPTADELAPVSVYAARMPVFAFVEMGNEYQATASDAQQAIAHAVIDAGADFVMANNPHWVQNSEVYKGKLVVYSLGNFIFDQIDAETQRGVSIDTQVSLQYDDNVAAWLKLGASCKAFKDSCLQKAADEQLTKIQIALSYTPVASQGGAGKITHKASDSIQKSVEERLQWAEVSRQLGQ
jgi:poly-gamma-glutamate synthesis protein (capsule biosynthesis protein)